MTLSKGFAAEQGAEENLTDWERVHGRLDPLSAYHANVEVRTLEDGWPLTIFSAKDHDSGSDSLFLQLSFGEHLAFVSVEFQAYGEMIAVERHIEGYENMRLEGEEARPVFEVLARNMDFKLSADEFEQHFINAFNIAYNKGLQRTCEGV